MQQNCRRAQLQRWCIHLDLSVYQLPKKGYCLLHYCVVSCFFTISTMQEGTNPARTTKGELRNRDQRGQKLNFCRICNFQILFKIIRCGTWAQCGLGGTAGKVTPAEAEAEPTTTTGDGYTQDIFHQNACQMRDPDTVLVAADRLKE